MNYGQMNDPLPSLEEQGIQQLYTPPQTPTSNNGNGKHTDRALILKRIAKSLLLNFLELVGIMSVNPEQVCFPFDEAQRTCADRQ
jgi:mediator of RNA polymerase II transcription subunit 7